MFIRRVEHGSEWIANRLTSNCPSRTQNGWTRICRPQAAHHAKLLQQTLTIKQLEDIHQMAAIKGLKCF